MLRPLSILALSSFLLFSCGNNGADTENASAQSSSTGSTSGAPNQIIFKVDGEEVKTTGLNISRSTMGGKVLLNITSSMHTDERTINVNLDGTTPGTYQLTETGSGLNGSGGLYFPRYMAEMGNSYIFTSGQVVLTRVDTAAGILEGTFSGTAKNTEGKTVNITDGRIIAGALNKSIQDPEKELTNVMP